MTVPAAKVKELCTASETELVRSSRNPALGKLTPAELKKNAARARKLYDKWLALSREQSRAKSKETGFGESKANTNLKLEIFGDALQQFENKLAKLDSTAGGKAKATTKKTRSAGHRATRAEVRAQLRAEMESGNAPPKKSGGKKATKKAAQQKDVNKPVKKTKKKTTKKAADKVAVATPTSSAAATKKKAKKTAKKAAPAKSAPTSAIGASDKKKMAQAKTAAKHSRIERSGIHSRVRGHVSARGKRNQARRDAKG